MATVTYVNDGSVLFSTASVYFILKSLRSESESQDTRRRLNEPITAGICIGLASFIEYMTFLFVPVLAAYLFIKTRNKSLLLFFLLASASGPAMHMIYNYVAFQNPLLFPEQLRLDENENASLLFRFHLSELPLHVLAYIISPYRGLILWSPILILGMYKLYKMVRTANYRSEAILFIALFIVILLPYSSWRDWTGGPSYGPRLLISAIPFITVPIAILLSESASAIIRTAYLLLFGVSSFIQGAGALTMAYVLVPKDILTYPLYTTNIPLLREGKLSTWLFTKHNLGTGHDVLTFFQLFAILLFLILWSITAYFAIKPIRDTKSISSQGPV